MNTYKKTMTALAIALAITAQASAMNSVAKQNFDNTYVYHFTAPVFKNKSRDFTQWYGAVDQLLGAAESKSSGDKVLISTISALRAANDDFVNAMKVGYGIYSSANPTTMDKARITSAFGSLIQKLGPIKDRLNKEVYILPNKREARDILNYILNRLLDGSSRASNA